MWEFVSYYTLSELVNQCGGEIGIDGQVSHVKPQFLTFLTYLSFPGSG